MTRGRIIAFACGGLALALAGAWWLDRRGAYLPGRTSDAHHLMEMRCNACHVPFGSVPDAKCAGCHAAELARDVHPAHLFQDPRWAAELETLDVTRCRTCHREHRDAPRAVTVPRNFCFPCHDDVVRTLSSHRKFAPDSCSTSGCHNYHDESALNIAYLLNRLGGPDTRPRPAVPERRLAAPAAIAREAWAGGSPAAAAIRGEWRHGAHARAGVGCADCHGGSEGRGAFVARPGEASCLRCHGYEVETFHRGRHGVRASLGLRPPVPAEARLPMKPARPDHRSMTCAACHDPHSVDTRHAAVDACLACHDDAHSRNFASSPHATLFAADRGDRPAGTAVTCATCHLPRLVVREGGASRIAVLHDNSRTMRTRERMVKEACLACHSLEFAYNAVFDDALVEANFRGRARRVHPTIGLARAHPPLAPRRPK